MAENIQNPEDAMDAGIEGRVPVQFTVQADGSVTDFTIMKSVSESIDNEALRVAQKMGHWQPAQLKNGEPVSLTFALPVYFKLKSDKTMPVTK